MNGPTQMWPAQPPPRPRRRLLRGCLYTAGGTLAVITAISIIAAVLASSHKTKTTAAGTAMATATPADTPSAVLPSADGTFQGSCDIDLGNSPATGTAVLIGEIDVTNTGNVGEIVKVTITWPQEGFDPIKASKTVHVPYATTAQAVEFHVPATSDQVDRFQSYELGHSGQTGCTYNGSIQDIYGKAH